VLVAALGLEVFGGCRTGTALDSISLTLCKLGICRIQSVIHRPTKVPVKVRCYL
jgi:hypothetical protein